MRTGNGFVVAAAIGAASLLAAGPTSAGSDGPNPCKLLKRGEIERVLEQPTAKGKQGFDTAVSKTCEFAVEPAGGNPDGVVTVYVQTTGAKIAYDTNRKLPTAERVAGIPKAYYETNLGALTTLKGDVLLNVQSVFISTEGGIASVDRKPETIELAKLARKRV